MKKYSLLIAAGFLLSFGGIAHAQTSATTNCAISIADFDALAAIQNNPNLSATDELTQELAFRKKLLTRTLTCAKQDAKTLKGKVDTIMTTGSATTIQSVFDTKIGDALKFYDLQSGLVNDAGIRGTQLIAQNISAWRMANYAPLEGQMKNFILWSSSQNLFNTAEDRLTKTQRVVSLIETATPNPDLQAQLDMVRSSLADTKSKNQDAFNALQQFLPADQSFALIADSLQSLANTYQKFADLNAMIQKVLPSP
jgi:hypothetical protein